MPEVSSANKLSLTNLMGQLDLQGVGNNDELRGKSGAKDSVDLYSKSVWSNPFGDKAKRAAKQTSAREIVSQAVDLEFDKASPTGISLAAVVKKNMRSVFEGTGAVKRSDLDKVKAEVDRVRGEFRTYAKGTEGLSEKPDYQAGRARYGEVVKTIPGFKESMSASDAVALYAKLFNADGPRSPQTLQHLGALEKWVTEKISDAKDVAILELSNKAVDLALDSGATSVKLLPQSIMLRQIGDEEDQLGRCLPMVMLAAMGETGGSAGTENLMYRMEKEVSDARKAGHRGQSTYVNHLFTLHQKVGDARTPIKDRGTSAELDAPGHRVAVSHLAGHPKVARGEPVQYSVETREHAMMIGYSKQSGVDTYSFFDPNFGVVRFDSAEKLSGFLDKYFGELVYGKSYQMTDKGADGFQTRQVCEVDPAKVRDVALDDHPASDPRHVTTASLLGTK